MSDTPTQQDGAFPHTHWTLIQKVQTGDVESAAAAVAELCRTYWYPIYAYLRRSGWAVEDAEDLTQSFFKHLIEEESLRNVNPESGRLRSFLLGVLKRMLSNHLRHQRAEKRGGSQRPVSFDEMAAEERYAAEPADVRDPETIYARAWAAELLGEVREKLRESMSAGGRDGQFEAMVPYLLWDEDPPSYRDLGSRIQCSESAARILIFRLRTKFRDLLREEVAQTVMSPAELSGEMAWLKSILSAS